MSLEKHQHGWVIVASFMIALMLAIMPLPAWAIPWRPDWVGLALIYWCIALPQRVGVFSGWLVGIVHDVLTTTLLGQHALSFCLMAYISLQIHRRLRIYPFHQQMIVVFSLILIGQLPTIWVRGLQGSPPDNLSFLYVALTSMLLWPWLFTGLRMLRQGMKVH